MKHININIDRYEKHGETILANIHTIINANDRVAVVGPNGVGKTTFFRILTGEIGEIYGSIENIGNIEFGYLEQIHFLDETKTVRDELKDAFGEIRKLEKEIERCEIQAEQTGEYEDYSETLERYRLLGGYTYENEVERVSRGIGIFHLLEKKLSEVSGGERTKIALVKTLLSKPDFLLLDEPTNFIDLQSVEWLEKYLQETWKNGYMIISHDREFLDQTVTKVIEITGNTGIEITVGNYSDSVLARKEKHKRAIKLYEEQQIFIEGEKNLINRFRAGSRAGFAKSREKMLEKIELHEKPICSEEIAFHFEVPKAQIPETILKIEEVFIGREDPLFYIREAELGRKDRIGIIGENGVGKSTLIKTILGCMSHEDELLSKKDEYLPVPKKYLKPLEGYIYLAKGISVGYYSQMHDNLDTALSIEETFFSHGFQYSKEWIGSILKNYRFNYHDGSRKIEGLSGGERSRLALALLCQKEYHLLILDEPTNHLDYETREALEGALRNYPGALLFISHDRYFSNKLANKIWIIEDGEMILSYGNYEDYTYKKEKGITLDMSLFDAEGELSLVLEEKLGAIEARRIKEKFARKKRD